MHAIKSLMVAAGVAMGLASGAPAQAANYYAAVAIRNPTNRTIYYQFRWGSGATFENYSIGPGQVRTHYWPYEYPDQNSSPTPEIRFHYNPGAPVAYYKTYSLEAYAVPYVVVGWGKKYVFRYSWDGRYLDLYKE